MAVPFLSPVYACLFRFEFLCVNSSRYNCNKKKKRNDNTIQQHQDGGDLVI